MLVRLRDGSGKWDCPLFGRQEKDDPYGLLLYGKDRRLEYVWRTTPLTDRAKSWRMLAGVPVMFPKYWSEKSHDAQDGVLKITVPAIKIGPTAWHDVLIRFRDTVVELFVDGVLVDEEWPHGALHLFKGPFLIGAGWQNGKLTSAFNGQIDHLAIWNRALTDNEITALSAGNNEVARRDTEILGKPRNSPQYWRPRGHGHRRLHLPRRQVLCVLHGLWYAVCLPRYA